MGRHYQGLCIKHDTGPAVRLDLCPSLPQFIVDHLANYEDLPPALQTVADEKLAGAVEHIREKKLAALKAQHAHLIVAAEPSRDE
jgi:hypothetical protein